MISLIFEVGDNNSRLVIVLIEIADILIKYIFDTLESVDFILIDRNDHSQMNLVVAVLPNTVL